MSTEPSSPLSCPAGEVVLVRHGQGECNAAGVIGGRLGCRGLSARGREESSRLADRLAGLDADRRFDALLTSPRPRVVECARIIASRLARPFVVVEALRGQEFGAADGRPWDQVIRGFGGSPTQDPDRPIAEGAEAWNTYAERVLAALRAVLAEHAGQRVLLVGHGKTTGLAGALLSGAADPRSSAADFVVDHGALSIWGQSPRGWALRFHNDRAAPVPAPGATRFAKARCNARPVAHDGAVEALVTPEPRADGTGASTCSGTWSGEYSPGYSEGGSTVPRRSL